jgi:hypothetical protein
MSCAKRAINCYTNTEFDACFGLEGLVFSCFRRVFVKVDLIAIRGPGTAEGGWEQALYSRRVQVQYRRGDELRPCPLKWLDSFSMRNFTNDQIFDDTLPVSDGILQVGSRVPLERLRDAMEDWFRRKSYLPKDAVLVVEEGKHSEK